MNATMAEFYIQSDLQQLNTTYVDLMLLHHICASPEETAVVWSALEGMLAKGQAKAIGVSNFEVPDLETLAKTAKVTPAANQCHFAVGEMDHATYAYCEQHGIAMESYGVAAQPTMHQVLLIMLLHVLIDN